jgi:hypothetical protein
VSEGEIDAVQAQYKIALPSIYVDFLRTMGEDSGKLYPFGKTYSHTFSELVEELPPEGYPPEHFFKVALALEEYNVDLIDIYLDLTRSDGDDAPLVMFETSLKPAPTHVNDYYLTFAERLVYRVFWQLDVSRRKFRADVLVRGKDASESSKVNQAAATVLTRAGFTAPLPDLRRVGCLTQGSASVLASISGTGRLVKFQVGGDARDALDVPVRELLAAFPGATSSEPSAERSDESAL